MKINVTQEHIDNGKRMDPFCCPVALALKDQRIVHDGVGANEIDLNYRFIRCPEPLRKFINDFDGERKVQPQVFDVDIFDGDYRRNHIKIDWRGIPYQIPVLPGDEYEPAVMDDLPLPW